MVSLIETKIEQIDAATMPLDVQGIKKPFAYPHLPEGNIRLLKLLPHRDITGLLQCSLINYPLDDLVESNHHLYDSLSYVWGSPEMSQSISIGDCCIPITTNLHMALLHLRDRFLERIIWVDAICINQQDLSERGSQVQRMAMIYALANRVIVWLGEEEDNSDQALEEIYRSADGQPAAEDREIQNAVLKLLQRPWFKRVWILQEMAAARSVFILCGSAEIDGYIFCMGINSLNLNYEGSPGLRSLIRTATYLMRRKVFHPKQTPSNPGRFSLGIAPLSELIDMYHTRQATDCRDKVYALLGMSSDNYNPSELSPNYDIQWGTLFQQVIKLIVSDRLLISTWQDKEVAIINSKCCIIGQVSSVEGDATWSDKQIVTISKYTSDRSQNKDENIFWTLTLQTLANSIQEGDIICLLHGASKPTIIRPHKDYFLIVAITVNSTIDKQAESVGNSWVNLTQSVKDFPRNLLLVWDWTKPLSQIGKDDEYLLSSQIFEDAITTQLMEKGLIMSDLKGYERAAEILKQDIENHTRESKGDYSHLIAAMTHLAAVYEDLGIYKKRSLSEVQRSWGKAANILSDNQSTELMLLSLLNSCDGEVIRLLSNLSWDQVTITEDVLKTAAAAESKDAMELLLDRQGDQTTVTEDIVKIAAAAKSKDTTELLLDRRGDEITITEDIVKAAAGKWNHGREIVELLLDQRANEVTITEDVIKAAVGNEWHGRDILGLLFERRGNEITITEDIIKAAAGNEGTGKEILVVLLDQRGDEITITEDIVKAAAGNELSGKKILKFLLKQRGNEITITEDIIEAAARNRWDGPEILEFLLDQQGGEVTITEDAMKAATWRTKSALELMFG